MSVSCSLSSVSHAFFFPSYSLICFSLSLSLSLSPVPSLLSSYHHCNNTDPRVKHPQPSLPTTLSSAKFLPEVLHFPNQFSFVADRPNEEEVIGESVLPQYPFSITPVLMSSGFSLGLSCPVRAKSKGSETEASSATLNQSRGKGWGEGGLARGVSPKLQRYTEGGISKGKFAEKKKKHQDVENFTRKTQASCYRNTVEAFRAAIGIQWMLSEDWGKEGLTGSRHVGVQGSLGGHPTLVWIPVCSEAYPLYVLGQVI